MASKVHVVVTGAAGFVGSNLCLRLSELDEFTFSHISRDTSNVEYDSFIQMADVVIHLAGVNRPEDPLDFSGNLDSVSKLTNAIARSGRKIPVLYSSSSKAVDDTPYGRSKKQAEDLLLTFASVSGCPAIIMRFPNVFGKWCKPNYNSAVATFCYNIARNIPISVTNPHSRISLIYIDDLIDQLFAIIKSETMETGIIDIEKVHETTVGEVANLIQAFHEERYDSQIEKVGTGLIRALYATYISYLPVESFSYNLVSHTDPRGAFSEMLKTTDSGQFSYFTAHPGVTRGGHYHHTKTEKFLVVHGEALFKFRNLLTNQVHEIRTSADTPVVVDTIPGWSHNITNTSDGVMVCLLWANELFDQTRPDTIYAEV